MIDKELDAVLSVPLAEVPDGGFEQRLMLRAMEISIRRERNLTFAIAGSAALGCALMPLTSTGQAVNHWALDFGNQLMSAASTAASAYDLSSSLPLAAIAGALAVAALVTQLARE